MASDRKKIMRFIGASISEMGLRREDRIALAHIVFQDYTIESYHDLSMVELEDMRFFVGAMRELARRLGEDGLSGGHLSTPTESLGPEYRELHEAAHRLGMGDHDISWWGGKVLHEELDRISQLRIGEVRDLLTTLDLMRWYLSSSSRSAAEQSGGGETGGGDELVGCLGSLAD